MAHINQSTIPIVQKEDKLIWKNNAIVDAETGTQSAG